MKNCQKENIHTHTNRSGQLPELTEMRQVVYLNITFYESKMVDYGDYVDYVFFYVSYESIENVQRYFVWFFYK